MNFSLLHIQLMAAVAVALCLYSVQSEYKGPGAVKLCGENFLEMYRIVCESKSRQRKSIQVQQHKTAEIDPEKFPFIRERLAKQFLRRVRKSRSLRQNAIEECCLEACTVEEVREYPCQGQIR